MTLGTKLKEARKNANLTQEQLADVLGVSRQAITKWESDKGLPDIENLKHIASILNTSIDYLLAEEEVLDFTLTRQAIKLEDYDGKNEKQKKIAILKEYYPESEYYLLISYQKTNWFEELIYWVTPVPFGAFEVATSYRDRHSFYFIVEKDNDTYLVKISDEFIESRKLVKKLEKKKNGLYKKFVIGEKKYYNFRKV